MLVCMLEQTTTRTLIYPKIIPGLRISLGSVQVPHDVWEPCHHVTVIELTSMQCSLGWGSQARRNSGLVGGGPVQTCRSKQCNAGHCGGGDASPDAQEVGVGIPSRGQSIPTAV